MVNPVFAWLMLVLMLSAINAQSCADTHDKVFSIGVAAFKNGDYHQARMAFEEALSDGKESASLHYNLGVTYYRLGEYNNAAEQFRKLTRDSGWKHLAYYNLGLVSEKQARPRKARHYYRKALSSKKNKVNALANKALARLSSPTTSPHYLFASLFAGDDDNVTLVPDQEGEGVADKQMTGFITGRYYLDRHWSLEGLLYGRRYDDSDEFDTSLAEIGLHREHVRGDWSWDHSANVSFQSLQGERYLDTASLETQARRHLDKTRGIRFDGEFSAIRAADSFAYLQGWRARGQARWMQRVGSARLELGYGLEINDREDLKAGEDFASFSPVRHLVEADVSVPISRRWSGRAAIAYQYSAYRKDHVIQGEASQRKDNRLMALLRADMAITSHWRAFAEYRFTDNRSTLDIYDYDRNEWNLGLEYLNFY